MLWLSTKKEIKDWMESKMQSFAQEESTGTQLSAEIWMDRYIYYDIHKVLFVEFLTILHEWLLILVTRQKNFQRREGVEWSD